MDTAIPGETMTLKEEEEYNLIESNFTYLPDERKWQAGYPWIKDPWNLPNNRYAALTALRATERRLTKCKEIAKVYREQMKDMEERNAGRKLHK